MKKNLLIISILSLTSGAYAGLITSVPGPDDQGGMIMPSVSILATSGSGSNPTAGTINISFNPTSTPVLQALESWDAGSWFAEDAAWRLDLGSPAGVGGTPLANAGSGDLFNNQYGFMFMGMGTMMMANVPTGKSLGIKLTSFSSNLMESFNYSSSANRWDQVFLQPGSQVLWNGSMWHNYFTLPSTATPGSYSATFEVFMANQAFTAGTGFADYSAAALAATKDENFTSASVTYQWAVVPEPSTYALLLAALVGVVMFGFRSARKSLK